MKYIAVLLMFLSTFNANSQKTKNPLKVISIAFYNLENLFDTEDDVNTLDEAYTPNGRYHWTIEKLEAKIENLAVVISKIGLKELGEAPSIIGIAEIENKKVLEKLIDHPLLKPYDYEIAHFDSPDRRGIDVGMLFRRDRFHLIQAKKHFLSLKDLDNNPIWTRDQLCVSGIIDQEKIHFIINHWPSRRGGAKRSEAKRIKASQLTQKITDSLYRIDHKANIVIMGDFNDNPNDKAFKQILKTEPFVKTNNRNYLYNPYESKFEKGQGSLGYRDKWYLFDQIILSNSLTDNLGWKYLKSSIFKPSFIQNKKGKYKGYPKRNAGNEFGYSDHFPVYVFLGKASNNKLPRDNSTKDL